MPGADIDSRDYIVAFQLYSPNDCPPDFKLDSCLRDFEAGVFLPRDDPDWFGRSSYPPRILLLRDRQLTILSHPSVQEGTWECQLADLISVEAGHMLLKGWLRFVGSGFDRTIRYNTRGYRSVFRFIQRFRQAWLGNDTGLDTSAKRLPELTTKFDAELALELEPGESVRAHFYQPPREIRSRSWLLPRQTQTPGDLVILTGKRLIWITDRHRGFWARYGTVASSARLSALTAAEVVSASVGATLTISLAGGSRWIVPLTAGREADAEAFAADAIQDRNYDAIGRA